MSNMRPEKGWNITRTPVHPGEMLREEFMKPLGISINGLALELHVPVTRISEIVNPTPRNYRRYRTTSGAALRHERRLLDEYSEGLRINCDPAEVIEGNRETGSPAYGCSITAGSGHRRGIVERQSVLLAIIINVLTVERAHFLQVFETLKLRASPGT